MPQQNGRAEHFNQTLFEKSEAMRHQACLPRSWWEFCVEYSVYVYNRTPIKRLRSKTPYEAINRIKPDISYLRILGCGAYVFLHEDVQHDVLSPHAELMTFIGFTSGVKGWKFMQNTNTIFHATKAVFNENMYPRCPDGSHVNIPAIETGVLPPPDSYLDRDNNIPPEDGDQPPPPPPAEIDLIWHDQGAFWPYMPDAPNRSGGFDFQPPSQPPSPGLSYRTPRTPSLRHRSVTPSHHSSGDSRLRSAHSHSSSGNIRSRSRTLTEEIGTFPRERELFPPTPA